MFNPQNDSNEANSIAFLDVEAVDTTESEAGLLDEAAMQRNGDDVEAVESEAGLLDEAAMQPKDQEALLEKIVKLERELKKALSKSSAEFARVKQSSEAERVKTDALLSGFEEKSMDLEKKLHVADAKLEEVNRKSLELDRKLQEVETHDSLLRRERIYFIAEREAHEATFSMQRNDLQEWERKLQQGEERLCEGRRITTEREVKVNETEMALKLKEKEKEIDLSTSVLKRKEDDINHRLANLTAQEHVSSTVREREFEVEMDGKRKSLNDEKISWLGVLQYKEDEITHRVEKLGKLELSLENKSERIKEKEEVLEAKLRNLKEKENLHKSNEKKMDLDLQTFRDEIEKAKTDIRQRESKIQEEIEKLKISGEERAEYIRLQSELKEEIEKCRFEKDLLLMKHENIKDMKNFEEKWEVLDESKQEELEAHMSGRERENENNNINYYLKEAAQKDMEELRPKRRRIEMDRQEISLNKKQLEENQLEKHKDINELEVLKQKVRVEREKDLSTKGDNELEEVNEDEDLDDESEGEVSISKKIWTFLTT